MFFVIATIIGALADVERKQKLKIEETAIKLSETYARLQASIEQLRRADRRGVSPVGQAKSLGRAVGDPLRWAGAAATVLFRCGRSRLRESAACSRDSVRLSALKRGQEGIGSDLILHPMHGKASRTSASDHEALLD